MPWKTEYISSAAIQSYRDDSNLDLEKIYHHYKAEKLRANIVLIQLYTFASLKNLSKKKLVLVLAVLYMQTSFSLD